MSVDFYDKNAGSFIEQTACVDMSSLYEHFCGLLPKCGSILDAGSGSGRDSLAFSRMGYQVQAFDASMEMVNATRQRASIQTHHASFETIDLNRKFDGVWACASLLHVPRINLPKALERLAKHLKPNGILYASFKYGAEERNKGGRYFNDLNEALLEELLSCVGKLELYEVWKTTDQRPDRCSEEWLNCLLVVSNTVAPSSP